jgi:hypothetical protein
MMIRTALSTGAVLALAMLGCQGASAFERNVTVVAPSGTYTKSVDANCGGGVCTRSAEVTGPNGGTASRTTQCMEGWRFYGCRGTVTGPNGNSFTRRVVGRRFY